MKEIRMNYSEYEEMVELIKAQQEAIEELKKQSNVVLVDLRYDYGHPDRRWNSVRIPKVISDTEKAKEMMKEEFDFLFKETRELEERLMYYEASSAFVSKRFNKIP